jgi:hypothetical protein
MNNLEKGNQRVTNHFENVLDMAQVRGRKNI